MACQTEQARAGPRPAESWGEGELVEYRRTRFRHRPELAVRSETDALAFINEVGLCLFQPNRQALLPSLYGAAAGAGRPAPRWGEHDAVYGRVWGWKDSLFSSGEVLYGKALGDYRLFVSLGLLPWLYAVSDMNYGGDEDDYLELYQDGKLSLDARNVYQALVEYGPTSTTQLRRRTGLTEGGSAARRFERALTELQRGLMISAVGVADDNAWKYTFRYDIVVRKFARQVAASRQLRSRDAMQHLLLHYLSLVGEAPLAKVSRLFGWDLHRLWRLVQAVTRDGELRCWGEKRAVTLRLAVMRPRAPDEIGSSIWLD